MKKAIIVGHTGQDGSYLSSLLDEKNYEVVGISSNSVSDNKYGLTFANVLQVNQVEGLVKTIAPDEVYFLAAVHQSSSDQPVAEGELLQKSIDLNIKSLVNFLEAIRKFSPKTKLFYAASSHIFGDPQSSPQDESTPLNPNCVYGITKAAGVNCCRYYREMHGIFTCVGIFYNHESPRRDPKYVSKKIIKTAIAIKNGQENELVLGNIVNKIDWGYAPDYVRAAYEMMQLAKSDDYIVSSGESHTVEEFVKAVFARLDLDWQKYVRVDPTLITKKPKQNLFGNNSKIRKIVGWQPSINFNGLVNLLVEEETRQ